MSFILDALRKSENERRLDSAPEVMRAPLAVPRSRLPGWAVVVMIGLAAGLVAIAALWWLGQRASIEPPLISVPASEPEPTDREASIANSAVDRGPPPVPVENIGQISNLGAAPVPEPLDEVLSAPEVRAEPSPPPRLPREVNVAELPSVAQLAADGFNVPQLSLQLLVNSPDSARRFVLINGRRYVEGETLSEGPEVISIGESGAVLRFFDRQFLLVPD